MKFINKKIVFAVTALFIVGLMPFIQSCSSDNELESKNDVAKLQTEYGLKTTNYNKSNVIDFNSTDEAKVYLEKIKNRKKLQGEMSINKNSLSLSMFSATYKSKRFNSPRQKLPPNEQKGWETTTNAGLFSDFSLQFNTGENDRIIDPSSITLTTEGARIGWAFSQTGVTMLDANSFTIKGTISWGIGVSGATLGYDEKVNLRIDINWNTGKVTWTEL